MKTKHCMLPSVLYNNHKCRNRKLHSSLKLNQHEKIHVVHGVFCVLVWIGMWVDFNDTA